MEHSDSSEAGGNTEMTLNSSLVVGRICLGRSVPFKAKAEWGRSHSAHSLLYDIRNN